MADYEWKRKLSSDVSNNSETWEHKITQDPTKPPAGKGWHRVFRFGIGSVQGGGGSPGRQSV